MININKLPFWLEHLKEKIVKNIPQQEGEKFAVELLSSIPVGVDLNSVKWEFDSYCTRENIERVLSLKDIDGILRTKLIGVVFSNPWGVIEWDTVMCRNYAKKILQLLQNK